MINIFTFHSRFTDQISGLEQEKEELLSQLAEKDLEIQRANGVISLIQEENQALKADIAFRNTNINRCKLFLCFLNY